MHRTRLDLLCGHLAWLVVAGGIALRLRQYAANLSLWLDEAMLVNNVLGRDWQTLLTVPLADEQAAPLGFLAVLKLLVTLLGESEQVLRLWPLTAACLALLLLPLLLRRLLPPLPALAALTIITFTGTNVFYATAVKQYAGDLLWTVLLLLPAVYGHRRVLLAAALLAPWCAHPAPFIAGGVVACLALTVARRTALLTGGLLLANAALALLAHRALMAHSMISETWAAYYLAVPRDAAGLQACWLLLTELLQRLTPSWLTLPLLTLGMLDRWRKEREQFMLLALPLLLLLVASALHVYPLYGRLVLFVFVPAVVLMARGATVCAGWLPVRLRTAALCGLLLAAGYAGVTQGISRNLEPRYIAELRPVMEELRHHVREGDVIWVASETRQVYEYYARRLAWYPPAVSGRQGYARADFYPAALAEVLPDHPRVWMVFAQEAEELGMQRFLHDILPACNTVGPQCDLITAHNALAVCFCNPAWPVAR